VAGRLAEWQRIHQPFELRFHQGTNYRWSDETFWAQWDEVFGSFLGLSPNLFGEKAVLLDLGCGSRPVLDWFTTDCEKYFLDPLLSEYLKIESMQTHWCGKPAERLLSQPAEVSAEHLVGKCDFVNCWNVLDHTYDWREILSHVTNYVRPGGLVCIGTDFRAHGEGHPGIDDPAHFRRMIDAHFDVVDRRENYVHREVALKLIRR